jgi:hypothetical protein
LSAKDFDDLSDEIGLKRLVMCKMEWKASVRPGLRQPLAGTLNSGQGIGGLKMRWIIHSIVAAVIGIGLFTLTPSSANAQWGGYGDFSGSGYGWGGGYGGQGVYGGGYGGYYGNGGHDYQPHWHTTQTPFGQNNWYGNGPHDFVPHQHARTPWSYQGYSDTGAGPTTSYYRNQPYYYAPW